MINNTIQGKWRSRFNALSITWAFSFLLLFFLSSVSAAQFGYGNNYYPKLEAPQTPSVSFNNNTNVNSSNDAFYWQGYIPQTYNQSFIQAYAKWFYNQTLALNPFNQVLNSTSNVSFSILNASHANFTSINVSNRMLAGNISSRFTFGTNLCYANGSQCNMTNSSYVPYSGATQSLNMSHRSILDIQNIVVQGNTTVNGYILFGQNIIPSANQGNPQMYRDNLGDWNLLARNDGTNKSLNFRYRNNTMLGFRMNGSNGNLEANNNITLIGTNSCIIAPNGMETCWNATCEIKKIGASQWTMCQ